MIQPLYPQSAPAFRRRHKGGEGAFTLAEAVIGMTIFVTFIAALSVAGSRMTGLLESQREVVAASQLVQERTELFRRTNSLRLTDPDYIHDNLLNTPSNTETILHDPVEVLTVSAYPPDGTASVQLTRQNGAVSIDSTNPDLAASPVVRVDFQLFWLSQRGTTRTRQVSTLVAKGGIND